MLPRTWQEILDDPATTRLAAVREGYYIPVDKPAQPPYTRAKPPCFGSSHRYPRLTDIRGPPDAAGGCQLLSQASRHVLSPTSRPLRQETPTVDPHLTPFQRGGTSAHPPFCLRRRMRFQVGHA